MIIVKPSASLWYITPDPLRAIESAARTCYKSEDLITDDSAAKLVRMLITKGHTAMLEFASAMFNIVCDRGVSHELVRHRIASYAQESTRFCNYSKEKFGQEISVIEPPFLAEPEQISAARSAWVLSCLAAEEGYFKLLGAGLPPQIARSVLPTCLKTEIKIKANFAEWRHILRLRTAPNAHPQMREIMEQVRRQLVWAVPEVFSCD